MKAGVIDPTKVVRSALQNAASIASLLLTTEALVSEVPEGDAKRLRRQGRRDRMRGIVQRVGQDSRRAASPVCRSRLHASARCTCPGCYAYGGDHLGGDVTLRELRDYKGPELVGDDVRAPRQVPPAPRVDCRRASRLVRYRELNEILPRMAERGIYTQLVTSAVRPIPRRVGAPCAGCRSSFRSTAFSPSTMRAASRPPTIAFSSTSRTIRSPCTARSRANRCAVTATSRSSSDSGRRTRP